MGWFGMLGDHVRAVVFILSIVLFIVMYPFFQSKIKKLLTFLDTDFDNPNYIRKTRKQLMRFVTGNFIVIFILALISIGNLKYLLVAAWILLAGILIIFLRIWNFHGYSAPALILAIIAVAVLSFFITMPVRNYMEEIAFNYIRNIS